MPAVFTWRLGGYLARLDRTATITAWIFFYNPFTHAKFSLLSNQITYVPNSDRWLFEKRPIFLPHL